MYQQPPIKQPWYKTKLGCAGIISLLVFCSCVGLAIAASASHSQTDAVQGVASSPTMATQATMPPTATLAPTKVPTATRKPTVAPKPTVVPTLRPAIVARPTPKPTAAPAVRAGVNGNPWGYDFMAGSLITNPPSNFCSYFACISSFWNGSGYVIECQDGNYSKSGGRSGECSRHGGYLKTLYAH